MSLNSAPGPAEAWRRGYCWPAARPRTPIPASPRAAGGEDPSASTVSEWSLPCGRVAGAHPETPVEPTRCRSPAASGGVRSPWGLPSRLARPLGSEVRDPGPEDLPDTGRPGSPWLCPVLRCSTPAGVSTQCSASGALCPRSPAAEGPDASWPRCHVMDGSAGTRDGADSVPQHSWVWAPPRTALGPPLCKSHCYGVCSSAASCPLAPSQNPERRGDWGPLCLRPPAWHAPPHTHGPGPTRLGDPCVPGPLLRGLRGSSKEVERGGSPLQTVLMLPVGRPRRHLAQEASFHSGRDLSGCGLPLPWWVSPVASGGTQSLSPPLPPRALITLPVGVR